MMLYFRFVATWIFKLMMWGVIFSMAWLIFSCDEFCEEPNRTAVVVNFFDASGAVLKVKNVAIKGIENDSILYAPKETSTLYGGTDFSQVLLPVNPTADFMRYTIKKDTFPVDTIIIRYSRHNGIISLKCGCVTYANIHTTPETTNHTITDLIVTNPNVSTVSYRQGVINEENIRIYY